MRKIPITLITGFLGSGKSTLINKILAEKKDLKIGLVLNEFGDVKLESQIINKAEDEVVELSNGCMCCVVRKDLISGVAKLIENMPNIDYIIVEASGLSDPVPIAQTFLMDDLEGKIRLDSILCVIDSLNFEKNSKDYYITLAQINYSDFILLSKTDLAKPDKTNEIKKYIVSLLPEAKIIDIRKDLNLDLILDTSKFDHSEIKELEIEEHEHDEESDKEEHESEEHTHNHYAHKHEHTHVLFHKTDNPINPEKFDKFLSELPDDIVRAKGFFHLSGEDMKDIKLILQIVGARRQILPSKWKDGEKKESALVFIGKSFNKKELEKKLRECEKHSN